VKLLLSLTIMFFVLCLNGISNSQILKNNFFRLDFPQSEPGPASNSVTDIVVLDNTIWFGTGDGISRTRDDGLSFESFGVKQGIGKGGVSALAVSDEIIWVATGFDSITVVGERQTGGGLAYSMDDGLGWNFVTQPGSTRVSNITFDIALRDDEVWITSFAGGLRKSTDLGQSWEIVTPDSFLFDVVGRLNHRAFSVISTDGVLWVGTAGGVNRSTDGGVVWTNFSHQNQGEPISGNFVVALKNQKYGNKNIIWAATRETTVESNDETEFRGVSWTEDFGFTWRTGLAGETIHNFAVDDSVIYAASDRGLFVSVDEGETWALFPGIVNPAGTRRILSEKVFAAAINTGPTLWVGTGNGIAKTANNGLTWEVFQTFEPTGQNDTPRTYAYPNPFSPSVHNQIGGGGNVRFQYNTINETNATLKIYDFGMRHVATVAENTPRPANGDFYEIWDGLNSKGIQVANGVYFYRLELDGDGTYWGKLIVLN
jgi:ligand-binding sensor domain-containing protein